MEKASILNKALQRQKRDLIDDIVSLIDDAFATRISKGEIALDRQSISDKLSRLIDHTIEKETATDTQEITILISDLRGFTAISEMYAPGSIIELLNRYFSKMCEIIVTKHHGTIDKFMGDSIMVLFGTPENRPDDLERALSCAVQMQIAMDEINALNESLGMPHLFMGIGINTARVIAGKLGSELHSEYTVIGDGVNLASRVESYSLRGQILISENTFQRSKAFVEVGDATQVHAKGKTEPLNIYELLAVKRPDHLIVPRREVRKSPRIQVDLPFTYQRVIGKNVLPQKFTGHIVDISYNGLLAVITEPLEVLSEIKFTLTLSILGEQTSDIYARILNVKRQGEHYQVAIEFTSIQSHANAALKSFINRIIQGT